MAVVLVVDDEAVSRLLALHMVEAMGHVGSGASGVEEALVLADRIRPDLILADFSMGDGTGLDLAERLSSRSGARVILLSGVVDEIDDERSALLVAHLTKPVRSTELQAVLANALLDHAA